MTDLLLRVLGGLLALAGGLLVSALALMLIPLRPSWFGLEPGSAIGSVRLPAAIVLAVAGNLAGVWFARRVTGVRWGAILPGVAWFAMVVVALRITTEGDRLLLPDDWLATLTLFGGTLAVVIVTVLVVAPTRTT